MTNPNTTATQTATATELSVRERRLAAEAAQKQQTQARTTTTINPVPAQAQANVPAVRTAAPKRIAIPGQAVREIIGNISKDPQERVTPQGNRVMNFSVAVRKLDANGFEMRDENPQIDRENNVEFFQIDVWENNGQNETLMAVCDHLRKGQEVQVIGRYSTRSVNSTRYPGQMMVFKTITALQVNLLKRVMQDGQLVYEVYNLADEANIQRIEDDLDDRYARREARMFQGNPSRQQNQMAQRLTQPAVPAIGSAELDTDDWGEPEIDL